MCLVKQTAMRNVIFLDIDGVLNSELHYVANHADQIKADQEGSREAYTDYHFCKERIKWLNELCSETDSVVVVSSTWRGDGLKEMKKVFERNGATFKVLDITPYCECRNRGCEISKWLEDNTNTYFDVSYFDFHRYAIIDDDGDMLLPQAPHFFQTDNYIGLTPNICYRVKRFLKKLA